uniref:Secreted protein n=1 Tax=Macaca fascicularis TaxID=9541 RepID=A0A7N9D2R8_MACFA
MFMLFPLLFILRQILTLLPRQEYSGVIVAHCNLCLLSSSYLPTSSLQVAGTIGTYCHAWLIFVFFVEMGLLCCPGWSGTLGLKQSTHCRLPECWDYRCEPPCLAFVSTFSFAMMNNDTVCILCTIFYMNTCFPLSCLYT